MEPKHERRWLALRAAIQMGGATHNLDPLLEDFIFAVAFWMNDEDACKCIAWMFKEESPAQRIAEHCRRLMSQELPDGYYREDGR